jgi:hypothetical protein
VPFSDGATDLWQSCVIRNGHTERKNELISLTLSFFC